MRETLVLLLRREIKRILVVGAIVAGVSAPACINEYEGTGVHRDHPPPNSSVFELEDGASRLKNLRASCAERSNVPIPSQGATFAHLNDRAACLIYDGKFQDAIALLVRAESLSSREYIIAANLGTAYELDGNLPLAIKWIEEGIARNPQAHGGTEWLHLDILKAKAAITADANWLQTHTVLASKSPRASGANGMKTESEIYRDGAVSALYYQLRERLQFVQPPDPVVADLLIDYGILSARFATLGEGKYIFNLAKRFGAPADRVAEHLNYAQQKVDDHENSKSRMQWMGVLLVILAVSVVVAGIYAVVRRLRRQRPNRP